ncbi:Gldg family protein [Leptolyngbya sp. FACHB-321]|uniref:GldG family protein n=1 Tax=Leptolyngbya sp. FACHB-321 TaxID=2692807 RepID=UPI0016893047|nr:Gldg family protein [Leptolyngbya sp. FACHB-321]MBD2037991.1 Gldg family protein [Leptolyngbya sp. FACHB-321]
MKTLSTNLKYLKYLFWLGPMLVVAGAIAGIVSGSFSAIPLGLVIAGIVVIGLWLVQSTYGETTRPSFWSQRSTQVGANALITTLAVIAILGLINYLAANNVGRLDVTENQLFSLAPETQQLVRNLKQPVKVWVFVPQPSARDRELLESYHRQSDRLSYEFVDPNLQPSLVQRLEVKTNGDVVAELQPEGRKQYVQTIAPTTGDSLVGEGGFLSEVKLTSALEQLVSNRQAFAYVIQGHGEHPIDQAQGAISQAVKTLKDKNVTVKPLNLLETATIPTDANVLVLAGPQKPLLAPEVKALEAYLNGGGNLFVMVDPNTNPGLDSLLNGWGVTVDKRIAIDASGRLAQLGPAFSSVSQYGDHPITKDFGNTLSIYPLAQPIDVKTQTNIKSTPLLFTSDRSWAESNVKEQPLKFDPATDRQGPLVLGFALTRAITAPAPSPSPSPSPSASASSVTPSVSPSPSPKPSASASPSPSPSPAATASSDQKPKEARLVVMGNSRFAEDGAVNQGINGDVFINSVRWLSRADDQSLSIRPKEAKNRRLGLSAQQAGLATWTAIAILPLLGFAAAFGVWWRRR